MNTIHTIKIQKTRKWIEIDKLKKIHIKEIKDPIVHKSNVSRWGQKKNEVGYWLQGEGGQILNERK